MAMVAASQEIFKGYDKMPRNVFFLLVQVLVVTACTITLRAQIDPSSLVDPFTGDLRYSIPVVTVPGPAGSGITINLNYSSDVRPEQEASWVGFGWNLDLPMISRSKRGLPDDYDKTKVRASHKVPDRITNIITALGNVEFFKFETGRQGGPSAGLSLTIIDDSEMGLDVRVGARLAAVYGAFMGSAGYGEGTGPSFAMGAHYGLYDRPGGNGGSVSMGLNFGRRNTPALMSAPLSSISMHSTSYQGTFKPATNEQLAPDFGIGVFHTKLSVRDKELTAYGFLWAPEATAARVTDAMLDYSTERSSAFEGLERPYAPFPVAEPDLFHVSADGISGTFRAYHRLPFEVHPPRSMIMSTVTNLHLQVQLAPPIPLLTLGGFGLGIAFPPSSSTEFELGPVKVGGFGSRIIQQEDKDLSKLHPFVFRYIADPADEIRVSKHDEPNYGSLDGGLWPNDFHELNRDRPVRSNTYVRPLFLNDVNHVDWASWGDWIGQFAHIAYWSSLDNARMIHGFEVVSPQGVRYLFDNLVLVGKETSTTRVMRKQESLSRLAPRIYYVPEPPTEKDTADPTASYEEIHEMSMAVAYADAFLPTSITNANYVDRGATGLSDDDDGGWTKFTYRISEMSHDVRSPYSGYWFSKGDLSNGRDDKLVSMRATRQVKNIRTIETPSHIATFYTNLDDGLESRKDAWPAQDEKVAQSASTAKSEDNTAVYLTRIELRKKRSYGYTTLVKTTYFAYDYSLLPGNPSSQPGYGKLTLRKVWSEDFDVRDAYISPVEFHYQYPTLVTAAPASADQINVGLLQALYPKLTEIVPSAMTGSQNPTYDPNSIDAWGFVGAKGSLSPVPFFTDGQYTSGMPYDATPTRKSSDEFTAPYTLKRIHTASGAEIVARYEPSDYRFVQDSAAMENFPLVPLVGTTPIAPSLSSWTQNEFDIDISAIPTIERMAYLGELRRRFVTEKERLQASLIYQVGLERCCTTKIDNALSNIQTYLLVRDVTMIGTIVRFTCGNATPNADPNDDIRAMADKTKELPFSQALAQFREAQRKHYRAAKSGDFLADAASFFDLLIDTDGPAGVDEKDKLDVEKIPILIPYASSLRLPSYAPKQSGKPRVHSIVAISPDGSLQPGDAALVGRRFQYVEPGTTALVSSGVATREPAQMSSQMGIVQLDYRLLRNTLAGDAASRSDIERLEGPIGENFLPGPSIGYARVVETSLFDGEANSGTVVRRFLTARQMPSVRVEANARLERRTNLDNIFTFLLDISKEEVEVRQGYTIHMRDGHGAPLSIERYSGRAGTAVSSVGTSSGLSLLSSTSWMYGDPESFAYTFDTLNRPLRMSRLGSEMEIISESKFIEMDLVNLQLQPAVSVTFLIPPLLPLIVPAVAPSFQSLYRSLKAYVTTKTIRHPLRLKSITNVRDGVRDSVAIIAFDSQTGLPAVTSRYDGFHNASLQPTDRVHNGTIASISVPALRAYPEMGQRSAAEQVVFCEPGVYAGKKYLDGGPWTSGVNITMTGSVLSIIPTRTSSSGEALASRVFHSYFALGDVLEITSTNGSVSNASVTSVTAISQGNGIDVALTGLSSAIADPYMVKIKRSGRSNQITSPLASYTLYGVDVDASKSYAKMLRGHEELSNILTEWTRADNAGVGFRWWKPLARYYAGPGIATNQEDAVILGKLYPTVSPPDLDCDQSLSRIELVAERINKVNHPYMLPSGLWPRTHTQLIEYRERSGTQTPSVCDIAPISNYSAALVQWSRWRKFGINDAGDIIDGIENDAATDVRTPAMIFGIRSEIWNSTGPTRWDQTQLVKMPDPINDAGGDLDFVSASGMTYSRQGLGTTGRGIYRAEKTFAARVSAVNTGVALGAVARVYADAGTFTLASLWSPSLALGPTAPWVYTGGIRSWNRHGLPTETEDALMIPTCIRYGKNDFLPVAIVQGATPATVFSDNGEDVNSSSQNSRRHTGGAGRSMSYTPVVSLAAITDARIEGTDYVAQAWIQLFCGYDNITVTAGGVAYSGTSLSSRQVGQNEGFGLFEFPVVGACSTFTVTSSNCLRTAAVDDILIRPSSSTATQVVYDAFDRPVASLDDNGWATLLVYDAKGSPTRVIEETVRGRNVVYDATVNRWQRRRSTQEQAAGIHSVVGVPMMMIEDVMNQALPFLNTLRSMSPQTSGFSMKEDLIRFKLTPEKAELETFPVKSKVPNDGEQRP